eukprot:gene21902-27980_t
MKGDQLIVGNVGDSRAIIASNVDGKLKYAPLSNDQTPYRKDERARLKKLGARIMTIEQIEGNEPMHENWGTELGEEIDEVGDPPRVWDKSLERPGCAFTRSLGDQVAKSCGVCAEPEILTWNISPNDRFAVVASDGVFEFITSQTVVDMIAKIKDPVEAAKHVVAEAYRLWLTYDDRTDDISIIVIYFEDITSVDGSAVKISANTGGKPELARALSMNPNTDFKDARPVRKVMSLAKRKDISENWENDGVAAVFDFDAIVDTKSPDEVSRVLKMLNANFMFENLSPVQKDNICKVMKLRNVTVGQMVIKEGDRGDEMYIINSGEFTVLKKDAQDVDQSVFVYTSEGAAFGELSLMYGKPRAASVVAKTNGQLWCIARAAFRAVIMKGTQEGLLKIYQTLPVLQDCSYTELQRLCNGSTMQNYGKGELIVSDATVNQCSWMVSVILTGVLRLIPMEEDKKRQLRAEQSYFGPAEVGSKFKEAKADSKMKLTCIPLDVFLDVLGTEGEKALREELLKQKTKGKRLAQAKSIYETEDNLVLKKLVKDKYTFESVLQYSGDFCYVGTFLDTATNQRCSIKVIAKDNAFKSRMDAKILQERQFLAALCSSEVNLYAALPTAVSSCQDDKFVYLAYKENFVCDLSLAIQNSAVPTEAKRYYAACLYSAVTSLHENGLMHRFINPGSVYITASGVPKLTDLRYAKRMDGSKSFTICGDPLYFAPEIISNQGYDYGADLWSFGVLFYELYEGVNPFGAAETEETAVFKAVTGYKPEKLVFSDKTEESARKLIKEILCVQTQNRLGYKASKQVKDSQFFAGFLWNKLDVNKGFPVNIQPSLEPNHLFEDGGVKKYSSAVFDQF